MLVTTFSIREPLSVSNLKDWPQRKVVLMQSSFKLIGSLCHSAERKFPISNKSWESYEKGVNFGCSGLNPEVLGTRTAPKSWLV